MTYAFVSPKPSSKHQMDAASKFNFISSMPNSLMAEQTQFGETRERQLQFLISWI
jgi:hypothetical protein